MHYVCLSPWQLTHLSVNPLLVRSSHYHNFIPHRDIMKSLTLQTKQSFFHKKPSFSFNYMCSSKSQAVLYRVEAQVKQSSEDFHDKKRAQYGGELVAM